MTKMVPNYARIFIIYAFIEFGDGHQCSTGQIFRKVADLRGSQISYDTIVDTLEKMKHDGEIQLQQIPRIRKNHRPFQNGAQIKKWTLIDFENVKKKHNELMNNEYLQSIIVKK